MKIAVALAALAILVVLVTAWRLATPSSHLRSYIAKVVERHQRPLTLWNALGALLLSRSLIALALHRLSYRVGHPVVGRVLTNLMHFLTGIEIYYNAEIGRGVEIWHGQGTVIGQRARIGDNCLILHQVTLGSGFVVLEHDVMVGAGAKILGTLVVGAGAVIGANAVVTKDVAGGTLVRPDGQTSDVEESAKLNFGTRL